MAKQQATNPVIEAVGSHYIGIGHGGEGDRYGVNKEECFPVVSVTWRGERLRVQFNADRYVHSSGWSEWRYYPRSRLDNEPGSHRSMADLTDTARAAVREAANPVVAAWLESEAYTISRRRAFKYALKRQLTECSAYSTDQAALMLERYGHELEPETLERYREALAALQHFHELTAS